MTAMMMITICKIVAVDDNHDGNDDDKNMEKCRC